ncbi:MAG TPA: translocation/assembly module TamB domain-containing protein [Myxococcaceae bacterium]|nr:translocation/assembly module TamB domain-containing protein [Myxococcaceae bacterium]
MSAPPPDPRRRRWPRRLAYALLALLALLLLTVGGALLYLQSPSGEARLRREALSALSGALQGSVEVKELALNGEEIILRGLKLYDPERKLVAEIDEVRLRVSATALVRRTLSIREATILNPHLFLTSDDRGLNLSRALAAKKEELERQQPEEKKPSRISFALQHLTIQGGTVAFTREGEGEAKDLKLDLHGLGGEGDAAWSGPERSLKARATLRGAERAPLEGPVALSLQLETKGEALQASVALAAPGLALDAAANRGSKDSAHVDLKTARVEPRLARVLTDRYPLQVPAQLSGTADLQGDTVRAQLDGAAGRSRLQLRGSFDVKRAWSDGFTLSARDVDLSELTPDGPRTRLQLEASARGGGKTLAGLQGEVKLSVPPSQVRGETLGPIQLSASADRGHFHLPSLRAELPGLSVEASGDGTMERMSLRGTLTARDLSELSRSLGRLREKGQVPALAGRGALVVAVDGPVKHPGLTADGQFALLRFQDTAVSGLKVSASIPDVTAPLHAEASLQAAEVKVGSRELRRVSVQIAGGEGAQTSVDARFTPVIRDPSTGVWSEGGEMAAHVSGTRDQDSRGMLVREFTVRLPEATWTLQAPAKVAFRDGVATDPLRLVSEAQSITVGGRASLESVDASLEVQRLDLKLLPAAFVDPKLDLAGLLSATVRARGPVRSLEVDAEAELDGGRVRRWDALGLTLAGHYANDRAAGKLRFTSRLATLSARFDLPVKGLARRRHEPIAAFIELDPHELGETFRAAGKKERVTGTAGATLTLVGTADDPAARLSIWARNLRIPDHPQLRLRDPNIDVTVEGGERGALRARAEVEAAGTAAEFVVRTPFTLDGLLDHPPDEAALRKAAYEVDASVRDFPLELLEAAGVQDLHGRASVRAEARGTLAEPALDAHVEGHGVAFRKAAPADLSLDVVAGARDVAAAVHARRGATSLADLTARLGAPLGALASADQAMMERTPLWVEGTVGPLDLSEWMPAPAPGDELEERGFKPPTGQLAARVRGRGTLADPQVEVLANAEQLRTGDACIGRGTVSLRYARAVSTVKAALTSSGQGRATVEGTVKLDLSAPALRRGVKVGDAPLEVALQAKDFELGVLGGYLPRVRQISGKLSADASVKGTPAHPEELGWVEWRDGALALDGYGDYRAIQVRAEGTGERFAVKTLQAQSGGGGRVSATADAVRTGSHFRLTGEVQAERFPVVYDDQTYAVVTSRMQVQGDLSSDLIDLQQIEVPEAHVELPDVKRKDLQEIGRPDDIVLVRRGKPVDRKHRAAAEQGTGGSGGQGKEEAGPGRRYLFTLHAPRNVWLKSSDLNMELGFSDHFRVEYDTRSRIYGDARVLRGRASVLGREFEVQRDSRVTFTGPPKAPHVNVTATYVNEREGVTVFMVVQGEGKNLSFKPSSQPPLPDSEIYVLLATGRRTLKPGSGASMGSGDAASVLGSLATSQLKGAIGSILPIDLDVLSIESTGGEGLAGTRVEVGRYLSDKAYLGAEVRPGADPRKGENKYGFRFEYQITPRLSVQTEYGDSNAGGADVIWSREY